MPSPDQSKVATNNTSDDIWLKCPGCKEITFRKEVERNLNVCPKCRHHLRLTVEQRLAITVDRGTWHELFADLTVGDPLEFIDTRPYPQRLENKRESTRPCRGADRHVDRHVLPRATGTEDMSATD